jgi:HlyD family secretion protein
MKTILIPSALVTLLGLCLAYQATHQATCLPPGPPPARIDSPPARIDSPRPVARAETAKPLAIVATGTVEPEEVVEVGAQVNGELAALGTDPGDPSKPINDGSVVQKGTVLAQIDPSIYQAQVDYAEATLIKAKADLVQLQARCEQTRHEWLRAKNLLPKKSISGTEYDLALANYQVADANVAVGQAAIQQCEASLRAARTSLDYTLIRSPIDGVVIDRRANLGQAVIAYANMPALFVIAKDLQRTQVCASVDEADIGCIRPGVPVEFAVDAYPGNVFQGKVTQVRLNPRKVKDRTTYTVLVAPRNAHGMLPYLTAKLRFQTERYASFLAVPTDPPKKAPALHQGRAVASR